MAYLVGYAQTFLNGSGTLNANMPAHQADDILIAYVTVDSGTITLPTSGGGGGTWAALPSAPANPVTNTIVTYLAYLKASGSAETFPGVVMPDAYTCTIYCFRDCYVAGTAAQIFDSVTPVNTTSAAGYTVTSSAVTTNTVDSLIVYLIAQSQPSTLPSSVLSQPGVMWIDQNDTGGTTATTEAHQTAAWYMQRAISACPTPAFVSSVSDAFCKVTFALRNKSGGRIPAYIDDVTSPGAMITGGHHIVAANNITCTTNGITDAINSKTATPGTAINGADFGINPFCNALSLAAAQTAKTALVGPEITLTAVLDASAGLIMGSFIAGSPKMGTFGIGTVADGGVVVRLGSGSAGTTLWNAYQVAAKDSKVTTEQRCVFAIEAGYAGSAYASGAGGNCSASAVKFLQFLRNAPYFSSAVYMSELHFVGRQVVAGGDSANPVGITGLVEVGKSFRLPVIQQAGANGIVSFAPVQIGGGDAVYFIVDAGAIQFPSRASASAKDVQYHASDNKVGLYLAGKSGDTIKLTNSVVTSATPYIFEITAGATSAATWDLSGLVLVGANVTLRNVMTFLGMSFSSCPTLIFSGCSLDGCAISKVPAGNDTLTTDASTNIDNCTINVTGVSSGNRWCSVADPTIFSGCSFTGGGGHAIRITTPGTYNFIGSVFTGFGADGSTGAAIFNDSAGEVILNISGGGNAPTYKNGTNATTTVNNNVTLAISAPVSLVGAEIRIYDMDNNPAGSLGTELAGTESHNASTYDFSGAAGNTVWIQIMLAGYEEFGQSTVMPSTSGGFTALVKKELNA